MSMQTMAEQFTIGGTFLNKWKFNGKELDTETGLYYYGARYYDLRTSLWLGVDPLAEKFPGRSSYEYCFSIPVMITDPTGEGGVLTVNEKNKTVTISAYFYFYGDKSNDKLAKSLAKGIQDHWNAANGTYTNPEIGIEYKVNFNIQGRHVSKFYAQWMAATNHLDPSNNFIKIMDMGDKSSQTDGSSNSGEWNIRQLAFGDATTTASHEFGHMLGLVSNGGDKHYHWSDTRTKILKGTADIMYPRGSVAIGDLAYKGTYFLDPSKRTVTQRSIDQIFIDNPNIFKGALLPPLECSYIGKSLNIIH